jgi:Macrocin-O-methyltransferase (TylF)
MKLDIKSMEFWEFGALGIHNPKLCSLTPYFQLIPDLESIEGGILELGVARGNSLITTALILESLQSIKSVIGVDSFTGFPSTSQEDDFSSFAELHKDGTISDDHYEKVLRNKELVNARGDAITVSTISNSRDFSGTSFNYVNGKVRALGLQERIEIYQLDISKSLQSAVKGRKFSLVLLDVDLYSGYAKSLEEIWNSLTPGGIIYLDEYYSLKFPGPRFAVNQFMGKIRDARLMRLDDWQDFERWVILKR